MDTIEYEPGLLFIAHGERIRFTSAGVRRFAERFGRCGIDIHQIKTRAQALAAMEASFPHEWETLVAQIAAKKAANPRERIEREYVVAIALGDQPRAKALQARIARLNAQDDTPHA